MSTRAMATQYKMAQWAEIMQERTASGMTIKEYCFQRGIAQQTYHYWQKKLREAAAQQLAVAQPEQTQALVPSGWATISRAEETMREQAGGLTLHVSGVEIQVYQGFDEALLASVCRALSGPC